MLNKETKMLSTVREFIAACNLLSDISDAYYVFEDRCSEELRNTLYLLADADTPEPFRSAMHKLGYPQY
jgi:hypothetical protein